jgi:2-polyprenyl-3-methyl-5-hydroxy-6-metoxy-1,4-benzoquinol methylase
VPVNTRKNLFNKILQMGISGELYDTSRKDYNIFFYGSIDRYSIIVHKLQGRKRVLDIGPGNGLLLSILHELGHECYAVDWSDEYKNEKNVSLK